MTDFLLSARESFIQNFLPAIKVLSVLISGALTFGIGYVIFKMNLFGSKVEQFIEIAGIDTTVRKRTVRAWQQILDRLSSGTESNMKLAIIEADKILDELLKLSGYRGDTLGDRLKQVNTTQISNVQDLWQAHKVRNRIVHEPDFQITEAEARFSVRIYERAFQELGLID